MSSCCCMGDRFEVLATNTLVDQSFIASPVIVEGDIYLRELKFSVPGQRETRAVTSFDNNWLDARRESAVCGIGCVR